jgi:hypothetical protein
MMPNFATEAEQEDWLKQIIEQTSDLVCAYKPNLGFYQALGSQGLSLLSEILSYIPAHIPIILDAKYGDLNSSSIFALLLAYVSGVEKITVGKISGIILSFIGVAFVTANARDDSDDNNHSFYGDLCGIVGAIGYGLYSTVLKLKVPQNHYKIRPREIPQFHLI